MISALIRVAWRAQRPAGGRLLLQSGMVKGEQVTCCAGSGRLRRMVRWSAGHCALTAGVVVAFLCSAIIMRPGSRE